MVPGWASGEGVIKSNLGNVDRGTRSASRGDGNGCLEDVSEVTRDVVAAGLIRSETESTTTTDSASRAVTPADWANTVGAVLAGRVA